MGATPESLAALPKQLKEMLTVIPPIETEKLIRESGIECPVRFFQAMMIHGWYTVGTEKRKAKSPGGGPGGRRYFRLITSAEKNNPVGRVIYGLPLRSERAYMDHPYEKLRNCVLNILAARETGAYGFSQYRNPHATAAEVLLRRENANQLKGVT